MNTLYNSMQNIQNARQQLPRQQYQRRELERGDKYIQSKVEEEEEDIPDYPDKLFAEKYDYKKYLKNIENDPKIKKIIRVKHFKNKPIEGKQPKRLPLPKDLKIDSKDPTFNHPKSNKSIHFDQANKDLDRDKQELDVKYILYYTEYLHQNKAQYMTQELLINKMAIDEKILFKKKIKNTKQLFQNLVFITCVEEQILYNQSQNIQRFLNQLKDQDQNSLRINQEDYKTCFDNFFNIVNSFINSIDNNIMTLKEGDILDQNLLEQAVLQSCFLNKKDIQPVIDNFIIKKDDQYSTLEKSFRQLNNVDNLLTNSVNLRRYMKTINTVLKQLDINMSITHDSENWNFDSTNEGKMTIKILIEKAFDNEEEIYILYDSRLKKRLTTLLPKQEVAPPVVNETTSNQDNTFLNLQNNQNTNTQMTIPKGQDRKLRLQQQQQQQPYQQQQPEIQEMSSQSSQGSFVSEQPSKQISQPRLYNPNDIVQTNCCGKQKEVSKLLQADRCKHYLCQECLIDPLKSSADTCLSSNCRAKISERELLKVLDSIYQILNIRCSQCNSNEVISTLKYSVTCKPPPTNSCFEMICKQCKEKKEADLKQNNCPICKNCDLTAVERSKYLQCKNCKFLKCKQCNLVIDRQQKRQEYCKCRCLSCLEIKKNESQDKQQSNHLFCQGCDETCCICRVQRRRENAYRCKQCKFFACIPCILKITCIKTSNSKQIEKCSHFMKHYEFMEKKQLPKIEIVFNKERLEKHKN
ncbi:hypothetical protein ABPG73_021150 [Tetrahymena malaccensis]